MRRKTIFLHEFFIIFLLSLSLSSSYVVSLLLPSDSLSLLDFKLKADLHNNLWWFNDTVSHCQWRGVQCLQGRVVHLVVEGQNLGGVFTPDSLTRLDQLRVLSLSNNSLTGPIPDLSGLLNLKSLFLHHNHFSGHFPPSIATLHRIRTVDLSYNNLTGELPSWLTRMDRVNSLRLEFNRFVGTIPPLNQSTLLIFNVSNNNLNGPIPITPVLSQFNPSCYAQNPELCGEIVHRECHPETPFFGPTAAETTAAPPPEVGLGQNEQLRGVELTRPSRNRTSTAVILGFSTGVFILIGSVLCFALVVKKQRRRDNTKTRQEIMASDLSASDVAAVMKTEEERDEKIAAAAGGAGLVFCAGEAVVYTAEQLMRASAEVLGRGSMGSTYKAVLDNRLIVCVKRLDSSKFGGVGKEEFERHMESVGGLRHPNLVPMRAYFQAKDERILVYDYQPNGSLFSLLHGSKSGKAKPLHWTSCLKIAEDVAQGLSYIHQAWRLVHGDLKSSNVLLGSDFEALLTDYCLNVLTDSSSTAFDDPSSSAYKAPEIRNSNSRATPKSDVYAFGLLVIELLTGKIPYQDPYMKPNQIVEWVRCSRDVEDGGSDEGRLGLLLEVAIACSMASPEQRPNMWQVLKMLQEIREVVLVEDKEELDPGPGE